MRCYLIFLFLNVFVIQAQKDSVRLVSILSSECGGTYRIEPHFITKERIGDTTFIRLSCTNNCAGYNNPKVMLSGDSVKIHIGIGTRTEKDKMFYRIDGKLLDLDELTEL